jgi:hypothetical protein
MVGPPPSALRSHLQAVMSLSERRACSIVGADRKIIRYRSSRPADAALRGRLPISISLRSPIAGATCVSRMAAPSPMAGCARQSSRARGIFILNGHRSTDRAGSCHEASELHQIRMAYDPIGDIDREIIGRIAGASLCHEQKVPRSIVSRASLCGRGQRKKTACDDHGKQKLPHHIPSIFIRVSPRYVCALEPQYDYRVHAAGVLSKPAS